MDSNRRNFFIAYICDFYTRLRSLKFFFPRRYNLMSENVLDKENKFTYGLLYISLLKVGSWSFEGIIILLIYFLNGRKALFTKT